MRFDLKRGGIGSGLMSASASTVLQHRPGSGLFLWVLEENRAAQAFYNARGGQNVERAADTAPDGTVLFGLRYVWPDPGTLLVFR